MIVYITFRDMFALPFHTYTRSFETFSHQRGEMILYSEEEQPIPHTWLLSSFHSCETGWYELADY